MSRWSEGVRVEASILARLLGLKLLKLDATVLVFPSAVTASPTPPVGSGVRASGSGLGSEPPRPHSSAVAGRSLADAVRSLNEGAELLAEARRNGS